MYKTNIFKTQLLNERLDKVIELIVEKLNPIEIILFGSYARGKFSIDFSEIDLLIIANTNLSFVQRIIEIRTLCSGEPHISPLIYTPDELKILREEGEGFIEEILEEGISIYRKDETLSHI